MGTSSHTQEPLREPLACSLCPLRSASLPKDGTGRGGTGRASRGPGWAAGRRARGHQCQLLLTSVCDWSASATEGLGEAKGPRPRGRGSDAFKSSVRWRWSSLPGHRGVVFTFELLGRTWHQKRRDGQPERVREEKENESERERGRERIWRRKKQQWQSWLTTVCPRQAHTHCGPPHCLNRTSPPSV